MKIVITIMQKKQQRIVENSSNANYYAVNND